MLKNNISDLLEKYPRSIDLSLLRIEEVLHRLGNPHLKLPPVIHIGGTNGKGSVAAMLFSIQKAAGKKVHLYTSPHLINVNERIRLAGVEVNDDCLFYALREVDKFNKNSNLTVFELLTISAFLLFSQIKADLTILEVGLGGRLDATNIIKNPYISALTPISYDHLEFLGNNLEKIAIEKAGIFKPGVVSVISKQPKRVLKVLEEFSLKIGSSLVCYKKDWYRENDFLYYKNKKYQLIPRLLQGNHQADNAALAVMLSISHKSFVVEQNDISMGLSGVYWPGRLQLLNGKLSNILKEQELWIDGAHNVGGINTLINWIKKNNKKVIFILALGKTKNARLVIDTLAKAHPQLVITLPLPDRSGLDAAKLSEILVSKGLATKVAKDIKKAIQLCNLLESNLTVIVTGSLYLVGEALKLDSGL